MPRNEAHALEELLRAFRHPDSRAGMVQRAAEIIRLAGDYRWVGLYDITGEEIAIVA